jgi:phosphoesterase RecJ-like protein
MTFTQASPESKREFESLISGANRVAITAHISPDDDAIASVLTLYHILAERYSEKKIEMIYTGVQAERYKNLIDYDKIRFADDCADLIEGVDLLIMLDGNQYGRFSKKPEVLQSVPTTICFDHHDSKADEFSYYLNGAHYTSTNELIYDFFKGTFTLTSDVAKLFLLGIYADTGNFSFIDETNAHVFTSAKELLEVAKVNISTLLSPFRTISFPVFGLIQELIKNTTYLTVGDWPPFQYSYVSKELYALGGHTDEEMSSASHVYMSHYLRAIEGYSWGFVVTPREGAFRVSGRSQPGSVDVNQLFQSMSIGGGHTRAAGGGFLTSEMVKDSTDCAQLILAWLQTHPVILK